MISATRPLLKFLLLTGIALKGASAASLVPATLECEARGNPIGIDVNPPRLSWKLRSARHNELQTAYEIAVASTPQKLALGSYDLWSTGRVSSGETTWIPYGGRPLASFQNAWWKVRVWSREGDVSSWSENAHWTTALTRSEDKRGTWISAHVTPPRAGPMPIFRREFTLAKGIRQATLVMAGLGFFEATINGHQTSDFVLTPLWTNYRKSIRYNTFDVTSLLSQGSDVIALMLGNGPFSIIGGRYTKYTASFGDPRVWGQLHLTFEDGSVEDVATDENWRMLPGPVTFSDFYGGEDFDARLEPAGWRLAGFDASKWQRAAPAESPGGELIANSGLAAKVQQQFKPIRITQPKPGIFVYDLGQNFAGWPRLKVLGRAGDRIRLTPGELLDAAGLVSQRSSGGPMYYDYTLRGETTEDWSPRFTYYGFRYVQVEGAAPEYARLQDKPVVQSLLGDFLYLDAPPTGTFSSSNETLNRIHRLVMAAIKSNLQSVLTDCPHREKLGWLEQAYLMGPSLLYDFDLRNFLPKVMQDIRESQTASGLIPDIAPEYVEFSAGFRDSPEWGSAGIMLPWMAWQWYGDKQTLAHSYHSMQAYIDYLQTKTSNGILAYGLGDWYDIAPGPPGPSKLTPPGVTSTATYFADLKVMTQAAELLGHSQDAITFTDRAKAERELFQQAFYKPRETSYATDSQTSLAMPIVTGLADPHDTGALVSRLISDIRARGNHTSAGDIGYRYVIEALNNSHASNVIFDMATEHAAPSYAAQLAVGATSLTEAWDANPESSQNHLMLGHIEEWFYNGLAGIRPVFSSHGGLSGVNIQPNPVGNIKAVDATWESNRGTIRVNWKVLGSKFRLDLDIPPGLQAEIYLPAKDKNEIASRDVTFIRNEENSVVYRSGSGHFAFTIRHFAE